MPKRITKKVVQSVSQADFETNMAAFAKADARAEKITAGMDAEITKIREKYADELNTLAIEKQASMEIIETYCTENQADLFTKKKSMDTIHGTVGFRTGTPKLKLIKGMNWNKVLDNLKAYLPGYVRTTEEPAKDRLLADRDLSTVSENLFKSGLMIDQDERFFIELKKEELAEA